ncbi:cobalt-precorrin 5A hydrolase [Dethiothermospora halolimnae]|uniref:cobalt-precorrin 5A hydrolase n=1 Tax=Dethiothermospora halolimnae TaxID=3114390 RepID=UPI003CCC4038
MKIGVLTVTKGGLKKGKEIKKKLPHIDLYALPKWNDNMALPIKGKLSDFVGELFKKYDMLLFIMATGIVVRVISKYIEKKDKDPAILVMDEKGQFIISLLSGHLGKANQYTEELSKQLKATPVITTASDVNNKIAVDTLAMRLGLEIDNLENAKPITSLIVNDGLVGIKSDIKVDIPLPNNVIMDKEKGVNGVIYITNKKNLNIKHTLPYVKLINKNIVLGIGCRRGIKTEKVKKSIEIALDQLNLDLKSVKKLATIDLKKDEKGIIEVSKDYDIPIDIIDKASILKIEKQFDTSEFVKKSIGVGAVCEPCGYLASNEGKCLMKKEPFDGITLSVWEEQQ